MANSQSDTHHPLRLGGLPRSELMEEFGFLGSTCLAPPLEKLHLEDVSIYDAGSVVDLW